MLLQERRLLVGIERAAGFLLALFGFRTQVVRQLLDHIVLEIAREMTADGGEVAIDQIHGVLHNPVE